MTDRERKIQQREQRAMEVHRACSSIDPNWYRMTPQAQAHVFDVAVQQGLIERIAR